MIYSLYIYYIFFGFLVFWSFTIKNNSLQKPIETRIPKEVFWLEFSGPIAMKSMSYTNAQSRVKNEESNEALPTLQALSRLRQVLPIRPQKSHRAPGSVRCVGRSAHSRP